MTLFKKISLQKSEFETIVDFHIQHQEERIIKKHFENVRNASRKEDEEKKCRTEYGKQLSGDFQGMALSI